MPVTAFRIKNFMAFEDSEWIELRKINLLYGRNSSGKSVLIRALRLLMQSLVAKSGEPITFVDDDGADLGSFKAARHRSPPDKPIRFHRMFPNASSWLSPISFGFRCEIPLIEFLDRKELEWVILKKPLVDSAGDTICFEASLSFTVDKDQKDQKDHVVIVGFDLWLRETTNGIGEKTRWLTLQFDPDLEPRLSGYSSIHFSSNSSDALGSYFDFRCPDGFLLALELNTNSISDTSEIDRKQVNEITQVWSFCKSEITAFLKKIVYVGPIRPLPERYYLIDGRMRQLFRKQGGQAYLDYLESSESASLQERIKDWMTEFDLAKSIRHNPDTDKETPDGHVVLRELVISERDNSKASQIGRFEVNIKDIGFGASQILPVIIACLSADDDAFIIVEQPELHLHPEAQASAADLFIECVYELTKEEINREIKEEKGRGTSNERAVRERVNRRCLIETHSEHILLRLQLRIAGGNPRYLLSDSVESKERHNLKGSDVGLIFVTRDKDSGVSIARYTQADPLGRLVNPSTEFRGFFSRDYLDSSEFALAVSRHLSTKPVK